MTTVDFLKEARALIADEQSWCQGTSERTVPVYVRNGNVMVYRYVKQRCSAGALGHVGKATGDRAAWLQATSALRLATNGWGSIEAFNDRLGHRDVLAAWDRAIADEQRKLDAETAKTMWNELRALECPEGVFA